MTRAQKLMDEIYHERNTWADTETKLTAAILRKAINHVRILTASKINDLQVIDKNDLLLLSKELEQL
jgi:hypothetical protein